MSKCKRIRELPESMKELQNLLHLDFSGIEYLGYIDEALSDICANLTNNLRYLSLSNSFLVKFDFIGTLTNLEHLDLSCNLNLSCLPESIGNLRRLQTLDLSHCYQLRYLPECVGTLGLKSLVLDGCSDELVGQSSSLVNYLQTLPVFMVRADEVHGCSNLHLLEGVHVSELIIRSLENVMSLEEASKLKLSGKYNLYKLTLAWSVERAVQSLEDKDLLEQLVPPRGLKSLCLEGYSSTSFPGWLMSIYSHLTNLVSVQLHDMPRCRDLPPLGQLPHLEKLELWSLPAIKRIDGEFCGGKGAFRRLSGFFVIDMQGLEEWHTTHTVEDGAEELMFPVLDSLVIHYCPRLRLKPCPPTFRECHIQGSDQVIFSLQEIDETNHHCSSSSSSPAATKLNLNIHGASCQSISIFHHFPTLREVHISGRELTRLPESMRHLTSLESLTLDWCERLSALPEWLGDLSSLKSLLIEGCRDLKSLPSCIERHPKLQKLGIGYYNQELREWCESEENKAKLAHINVLVSSLINGIVYSHVISAIKFFFLYTATIYIYILYCTLFSLIIFIYK
jgi:hypothetical protein